MTSLTGAPMPPISYSGILTPEDSQGYPDRTDSPIDHADGPGRPQCHGKALPGQTKTSNNGVGPEVKGSASFPKKRAAKSQSSNSSNSAGQEPSAFRFVVVDHPNQLRDRKEMKQNRMHVMHDYLNKERQRPVSKDTRVNGAARAARKQNCVEASKPSRSPQARPKPTAQVQVDVSRFTPPDSQGSDISSDREDSRNPLKRPAPISRASSGDSAQPAALMRRKFRLPSNKAPFVPGLCGRWEYSPYMKTTPNDIPINPGKLTEPFDTWPTLIDPSLDVNMLKWSCIQRFGSDRLSANWIPVLLRARHAFLSTLCISSSHDAVMTRALQPANAHLKSVQRWKVKRDVIAMLAECLKDPQQQLSDETMVSVVHLLVSDIMGCDDRDLKIHQDGLQNMAAARGGLDKLGVNGELAAIITIMNYLIAALREMRPHRDYIRYASNPAIKISDYSKPLPESPLLCNPTGFRSLLQGVNEGSQTHNILDTIRSLTNQFFLENGQPTKSVAGAARFSNFWGFGQKTVADLAGDISAFLPANDLDFDDMNQRYTYEAIRLTSRVYAYALANKVPFSKAAAELSTRDSFTVTPPGSRKSSDDSHGGKPASLPIQIKQALAQTDMSFCWNHLGGVLFWVALVGGAAANPGAYSEEERKGEEEDARKFLAAIAVRCCVVLSFEYGIAILETLKRLVMLEEALAEAYDGGSLTPPDEMWTVPASQPGCGKAFGPAMPSTVQKGFADFVQDFMSA